MDDRIRNELLEEKISPGHQAILDKTKSLVKDSRKKMSEFYEQWDLYDCDYRGKTHPSEATSQKDEANAKSADRAEPIQRKIPLTYAQVDTFVAIGLSLLYQDESLFPLEGTGPEDADSAKVAQALLDRDLEKSNGSVVVEQHLKDVARFGLGVLRIGWCEETADSTTEVPQMPVETAGGIATAPPALVPQTTYKNQRNEVYNVSPYLFFPDTRLPIRRFQEGEFCASEEEHARATILSWEKTGRCAGVKFVNDMTIDEFENRGTTRLPAGKSIASSGSTDKTLGVDVLTEAQVCLIPSEYEMADGQPLGPEEAPVKYNVWILNDHRIIKLEPLGYPHNRFTYSVGLYNPDIHYLSSEGLVEMVSHLQSLHNWFINAHITSVKKIIDNKLFVDPSAFEMKDLLERKPLIRMKSAVQGQDINRFVFQLNLQDVTKQHVGDAAVLAGHMKEISGINENMLGQTSEGRRSATEKRAVNTAALGRIKKTISGIFTLGLKPAGEQMIANHRAYLEAETYVRVIGDLADPMKFLQFKSVTKDAIQGNFDFKVFDPTMPSERHLNANALMELLTLWLGQPAIAAVLPLDPVKLVFEIFRLRGIRNVERFLMSPERMLMYQTQMALAAGAGQQNGEPGQDTGQGPSGNVGNPAAGGGGAVLDLASMLGRGTAAGGGGPARAGGY